MQNLVYEWVDFSKFSQIWAKICSNLRKFWKNWAILLKIWPKIETHGTWFCYFSWIVGIYLSWVYFQIPRRHILPKPNLSTPRNYTQFVWYTNRRKYSKCYRLYFFFQTHPVCLFAIYRRWNCWYLPNMGTIYQIWDPLKMKLLISTKLHLFTIYTKDEIVDISQNWT